MTEQQALDALAAHLPPDAIIDVRVNVWLRRRESGELRPCVNWFVRIYHEPSGYIKCKSSHEWTAEEAIAKALAKWRAYQKAVAASGLPRWRVVGDDWKRPVRVRLVPGRLFFRDEGEAAREVDAIVRDGGRAVDVAGSVPRQCRELVLLRAIASAAARRTDVIPIGEGVSR